MLLASLELVSIRVMLHFYGFMRTFSWLFVGTFLATLLRKFLWMFSETLFITLFDCHSVHVVRLKLLFELVFIF